MIKLSTALIIVTPMVSAGEWTAQDKQLHFKYGVFIGAAAVTAFNFAELDINRPLAASLTCSSVGLAKEIYDQVDYGGADWKDFTVTAAACFIGSYTMHEFINMSIQPLEGGLKLNFKYEF